LKRVALISKDPIYKARWANTNLRPLEDLVQDVSYGAGMLRRTLGFTVVAILTVALGIGSCSAVFSVVNAVLLRPLPYGSPGQLVFIYTPNSHLNFPPQAFGPSFGDFSDLKRKSHSFSDMTIFEQARYNLASQESASRVGGARVDANFFSTLASKPELGRAIASQDDQPGYDKVVVISHAVWQDTFGGDPNILTKTLLLNGRTYRIIGVMPPEFRFPHETDFAYSDPGVQATDLWIPLGLSPRQQADRDGSNAYAIGRLKKGVSLKQVQSETSTLMASLDLLHTEMHGWGAFVEPLPQSAEGSSRRLMGLLLGSVAFVFLISCANAANLFLARAAARIHEFGIRAALGAGRSRLVRQMLTESLLLGCAGALAGVLLAYVAIQGFLQLAPNNIPRLHTTSIDGPVLAFTAVLAILTSLLFGMFPALSISRINVAGFAKAGGTRQTVSSPFRFQNRLVVAQVTLVVVLLTGAGLLIRSYLNVESTNPGFSLSTLSMDVDLAGLYRQPSQRLAVFREIINRIGKIPGVEAVGAINSLPLSNSNLFTNVGVKDGGHFNVQNQVVEFRTATPEYFSSMNIPLVKGRLFSVDEDTRSPAEVVINLAFARRYFGEVDPIGHQVVIGRSNKPPSTIVGVVDNVHHSSLEEQPPPEIYSDWQNNSEDAYITVRSVLQSGEIASQVRSVVRTIDPNLAIANLHTMSELVSETNATRTFQTILLTVFAGSALFLAMVGLYGLLAYSVKQRSREIGVRMALGAQRAHVLCMIIGKGMALAGIGIATGIAGTFWLTRFLRSYLFGIKPTDPLTFVGVAVVLFLVALAACYIPARRATRVDPMMALRYE
jgi:predicted permease